MRFGFFTDIHLAGINPRHRVDDFPRALLNKLREIYKTGEAEGCEFMAFGGDFFNTHRIFSYEIIGDAMDIICESPMHTYGCIGEHDLYGHSPDSYPSSTLAFFVRRCPRFHILFHPMEIAGTDTVLHGKHEWEPVAVINGEGQDIDPSKYNILLCHELITNRNAPFDVTHTSTLPDSPFDLVCSGDLHSGYSPHEVNGTWFCNPGSVARRNTSDTWHPSMAIVDVEKGIPPVFNIVKLKCAQPHDDVFGESAAEILSEKQEEREGNDFAEELLQFEADAVDVRDLIQKVGKFKGIRQALLDYLATKGKTAA